MGLDALLNLSTFANWRNDIDAEIEASIALYLLTERNTVSYNPRMGTEISSYQGRPLRAPTGVLLAGQAIESLQQYNEENSYDFANDRRAIIRMEDIEIDDKDLQSGSMDLIVGYTAIKDIESGENTLRKAVLPI